MVLKLCNGAMLLGLTYFYIWCVLPNADISFSSSWVGHLDWGSSGSSRVYSFIFVVLLVSGLNMLSMGLLMTYGFSLLSSVLLPTLFEKCQCLGWSIFSASMALRSYLSLSIFLFHWHFFFPSLLASISCIFMCHGLVSLYAWLY